MSKVLVTEQVAREAIDALTGRGCEVDVKLDLSPDELIKTIPPYDALIVRSATKVTPELLDAAENLKVIGRAGVTVDNIDIESCGEHNVVVCNAPTSNIISAAEHTMALMLAAARNVVPASNLVHSGEWKRHEFMGTELYGKTLAIFGLGRIGSLVAERAKAFGMNVIAYDPYCSIERAQAVDVELVDNVDEAIEAADVISVHLPRTSDTIKMFGPDEFAKMRTGVILINAARGDIFDLDSLADFVAAGKIGAVALDVFSEEPCYSSPMHEFENTVLTPHISAVTAEAQVRAGQQIAQYVWDALEGAIVPTSITATAVPPEVIGYLRPYTNACRYMGKILLQILGKLPKTLRLTLEGSLADLDGNVLSAGLLDGFMEYEHGRTSSVNDVLERAERHGINLVWTTNEHTSDYSSAVRVKADNAEISMTIFGTDMAPRIISLMGYSIDIAPAQNSLIFEYADGPGRIGVIGTILGDAGINITTMQIGTKPEEKCSLVYINVEGDVTDAICDQLKEAIDFKNLWRISL